MKNNLKYLACVILFAFLSCKKDDGLTVVEGRLFDSSTNKGIKDAIVYWEESDLNKTKWQIQSKIRTDADGHYRFQFIASTNSFHRVQVSSGLEEPTSTIFQVPSGDLVDININKRQTIDFPACICSHAGLTFIAKQGFQTDSLQVITTSYNACNNQLKTSRIPTEFIKSRGADWYQDMNNVASNLPFQSQIKRFKNGQVISDTTIIRTPLTGKAESIEIFY